MNPNIQPIDLHLEHNKRVFVSPTQIQMATEYARYFGAKPGGIDLINVIATLDTHKIQHLHSLLSEIRERGINQVFVLGNGGSFDNALSIALELQRVGINAKVPGDPTCYFATQYDQIFVQGIQKDGVKQGDLLIALSGSGNSPNVLNAFTYAQSKGAQLFALGGRDGGQMRVLAGDSHSLIAKTPSMEALEDAHYAIGLIVASALQSGRSVAEVHARFVTLLKECLTSKTPGESNITILGKVGVKMIETILSESELLILGDGIGSRHMRADAGRGFTNCIPLRGLSTPEFFTTNSGMATCNDDGPAFLLADGLAKIRPSPDNFALLMYTSAHAAHALAPCVEILHRARTPHIKVGARLGEGSIDFAPLLNEFDPEFVPALIGHASGTVVREYLNAQFGVRELTGVEKQIEFNGQRKLSHAATEELETALRNRGILSTEEVITFAYGKLFAVTDPSLFGLRRGHY